MSRSWTMAAFGLMALAMAPGEAFAGTSCGENRGSEAPRVTVFGITADNELIRFQDCFPRRAVVVGSVPADTIGIDFRVQDGLLYGVSSSGALFTIDTTNGATGPAPVANLTIVPAGASFGVDFNPAANALRIISDTGQNLRHPFAGMAPGVTLADGTLMNPTATPPTNPQTGIAGAAYTNNDLDTSTGTTLFDIASTPSQVLLQSPANSGNVVPTGGLGLTPAPLLGFDIYSRIQSGVTIDNHGFAALTVDGVSAFYAIDLTTGQATRIGGFPDDRIVTDIAAQLGPDLPPED